MTNKGWGLDSGSGAVGDGSSAATNRLTPVDLAAGTPHFMQIVTTMGTSGAYGLTDDGHVYAWGQNNSSQLGITGDVLGHPTPSQVPGLSGIAQIAGSANGGFALTSTGDLYAWGDNSHGQLGLGATSVQVGPTITATGVQYIGQGWDESILIKTTGTVQTCGWNTRGAVGDGTTTTRTAWTTVVPAAGKTAIASAAYKNGLYVLMSDGTVYGAGETTDGQLGILSATAQTTWLQLTALSNVVTLGAAYGEGYFVLSDNTAWSIGLNTFGALGVNIPSSILARSSFPRAMAFPTGVYPLSFGRSGRDYMAMALGSDHGVYTWGHGDVGQMGNGFTASENRTPLLNPNIAYAAFVGGGGSTCFADTATAGGAGGGQRAWAAVIG